MKKGLLAALLAGGIAAALVTPLSAYADGHKVVTLGADLSDEQKTAVLKYFGVLGQSVDTIYITNADERAHLGSYVPLEQIGTHTFSCAMVNPTNSGGIRVKTANLSWVTSNMIASTLSTSGVKNCEVLAASPFEVSGTGALTGVIMAYETASGTVLDTTKKEIATQELITTGQIANEVGQAQATNIVNEIKIQVIEGQVVDQEEVSQIVDEVVSGTMVDSALSDEDRDLLKELAEKIAAQQYDYEDMKDTLERVEENVSSINESVADIADGISEMQASAVDVETAALQNAQAAAGVEKGEQDALPEDSILTSTDDTVFGTDTIIDSTDEEALPDFAVPEEDDEEEDPFGFTDDGFDVFNDDSYTDDGQDVNFDFSDIPADGSFDPFEDADDEDEYDPFDEGFDLTGEDSFEEFNEDQQDDVQAEYEDPFTFDPEIDANDEDEENGEEAFFEEEAVEETLTINDTQLQPADTEDTDSAAGSNVFELLVDTADVVPVSGTLVVTDEYGATSTVDLSSASSVKATAMSAQQLSDNGWDEGTRILIVLDDTLDPDNSYEISLEGTFTQEGTDAQTDVYDSAYVSTQEYGIALNVDDVDALSAGRNLNASLIYDEEAAYAQISDFDASILSVDASEIDLESGDSFGISLLQSGEGEVTVDFFDAEGNYLSSATTIVTVL